MTATTPLREALNQGISSGNFVDTKIIVYSYRDSTGRVCRPKALYASSHVLRTVPHFNDGEYTATLDIATVGAHIVVSEVLFGGFGESQSKDFKEAIDEEGYSKDYDYFYDSDLEDEEDERVALVKPKAKSEAQARPFNPFAIPGEDNKIILEEHEESVGEGKVVEIPDVAFVTFQAFLMYLYTDTIEFAPFGSEENRRSRSAEFVMPSDDKIPSPSPKSIYRFADKYDVPALKALALDHIGREVAKCDIVEEAFSPFASRYEDIRNIYANHLSCIWMSEDSTAEETRVSVEERMDSFAEGELEHADEIITALWEIASKDGDAQLPEGTSPTLPQVTSPAHWATVKTALIKSVRIGVFFDRKYWARHFKAGDVLKPVYFSSTVMADKSQQLKKLVSYVKSQNSLVSDLEGDLNIESDCESDSTGLAHETPGVKKEEEEIRAVLVTGSFSAWKSLFFYRCTDAVSFAPLKSQGVDSRLKHIQENTVATAPPPCSPKSIYVLAKLLEIEPLYDSAFADIKSKVSSDNVVAEAFSWVTTCHKEIMEMQCDLLASNLKDPKTISLMKENIEHIQTAGGSLSYCAGSLRLGLRRAFERKKGTLGVKLRCVYSGCSRYNTHVSHSSICSDGTCPHCRNWMYCVGCGSARTGTYASCNSCRKKFL